MRKSRNENGGRLRLILVKDDDEDDVVILDEVEDLAVRSFDPLWSSDIDCLSFTAAAAVAAGKSRSTFSPGDNHEGVMCLPPSTTSLSLADDVETDRCSGGDDVDRFSLMTFPLKNGNIFDNDDLHSELSSVGLLLALVLLTALSSEPMIIIFECFFLLLELSGKSKMEFCTFAIESEELELPLIEISTDSLDFGRLGNFSGNSSD